MQLGSNPWKRSGQNSLRCLKTYKIKIIYHLRNSNNIQKKMKRTRTITILVSIAVLFVASMYWLYSKNIQDPVVYETQTPVLGTVVKKTVATGSIVPKEEVLIKPNISGIIDEIYVEAGEVVKAGDLIAKVKVVPNVSSLNSAQSNISSARTQVETARLAFENQKSIFNRQKELFEKGVISANE